MITATTVDWTGLGAFITGCATFVGVAGGLIRGRKSSRDTAATRNDIEQAIGPRIVELHEKIVNGSSKLPDPTDHPFSNGETK